MSMNTMDAEVGRLLEAGKNAARNGDTASARSYLTQVVERDPHNELAWMWLSGVATEPEEQQICLENVLVINPYNAKARQGLEFLSARTGIPTQAPPVPTEYTSPLSDVTALGAIQSPFGGAPAPGTPPAPDALPDFSAEFALPPWMENGAVPDPLAGAGGSVSPGGSESLAFDMFASTPPAPTSHGVEPAFNFAPTPPADSFPPDPWSGLGVSDDSLNIDWSRGMDTDAGANGSNSNGHNGNGNGNHAEFGQQQAWGGMEPYQQADGNGAQDNGLSGWSMDNVPGFEPLEPGSLGFGGQAAGPYADTSQAGPMQGDWQQNGQSGANGGGYGPMGPAGDFQLPTPTDLPGFEMTPQSEAKPWYALSSQLSPGMVSGDGAGVFGNDNPDERTQHLAPPKKDQVMVTCPHCAEQVPETSLSCTRCGFAFFVNCPHCHELVDVIDAKPDVAEPCPYCSHSIEKMKLGMTSADPTITYVSERPVKPDAVAPEMKQYIKEATRRRGRFTWSWVVDVMWLVAIVLMVWVLTQLPAWWHLSGQY